MNTTVIKKSTVAPSVAVTSTSAPQISNYSDDLETIIEQLDDIKIWIIIMAVITLKFVIIKAIKMCRRGYKIHNESVIQRHTRQSPQI